MSESPKPRQVLHLVMAGFPPERLAELTASSPGVTSEVLHLKPDNARAALEKIFAADSVAVWGQVD